MVFVWLIVCTNLLHLALALTKDQIFQHDWQTYHIGIPFKSIELNDTLITLSSNGILSTINTTDGDVLYRYQSDINPVSLDSGLIPIDSNSFVSYFNYENLNQSLLIVWKSSSPYGSIENEFIFDSKILSVQPALDKLIVFNDMSISVINYRKRKNSIERIFESSSLIKKTKTFFDLELKEVFIFVETDEGIHFSKLSNFDLKPIKQLEIYDISTMRYNRGHIIFNNDQVFEIGDEIVKVDTKSNFNLITNKLSANSLISTIVDKFEVINDHVIIESNNHINLFNHQNVSFVPNVAFEIPREFLDSVYLSYFISSDDSHVNILSVSSSDVVSYYVNGLLKWSSDQSFTDIVDIVILENEHTELSISSWSSFLPEKIELSPMKLITSMIKNLYKIVINDLKTHINNDNDQLFGMCKKLVVLSKNNKIGVYNMNKHESYKNQLVEIFSIPSNIKIEKLHLVNDEVLGVSDDGLFKIDIAEGTCSAVTEKDNITTIALGSKLIVLDSLPEVLYTSNHDIELNEVRGYKIVNGDSFETFHYSPENEQILSLTKRSYGNDKVAQNGIVLSDRSVLYKYLTPNIGVITSYAQSSNLVVIRIINLVTGKIYGSLKKEVKPEIDINRDINVAFEEHFIIFTIPDSKNSLNTEICSIDLFESLKPNQKFTKDVTEYSSFGNSVLPSFASQCFIIPFYKVNDLSISKTVNNIAIKDIILRTSNGQIMSVPKMMIDGTRNGVIGNFNRNGIYGLDLSLDNTKITSNAPSIYSSVQSSSIVNKFTFNPIINFSSQSILSHIRRLTQNSLKDSKLFTVPTNLESTTYVVSIDGDIFVSILRPSGSFDKLTPDFATGTLIMTIVFLTAGIIFIKPKLQRQNVLRLWNL